MTVCIDSARSVWLSTIKDYQRRVEKLNILANLDLDPPHFSRPKLLWTKYARFAMSVRFTVSRERKMGIRGEVETETH